MATYLQDKDVAKRYAVVRPTIWRWVKNDPSFPRPVSLSSGCTRWRIEDLERWERSKSESNAA